MPPTAAVIDIGSNSIKLLVAARERTSGRLTARLTRTLDVRISAGISADHPRLGEQAMARGVSAIADLLAAAAPLRPTCIQLVATSAVRDAANGADFRARVQAATGHRIRILAGDEEANLIGRGLTADPALADLRDFYVFDLGGGSLECLAFIGRRITAAHSARLGCVRLTERFVPDPAGPVSKGSLQAVRTHVRATLATSPFRFGLAPGAAAVFAGGSMTTARAILAARRGLSLDQTPPVVTPADLADLLAEVAPHPLERRREVPGLPAARADVFPVALATMHEVATLAGVAALHHSLYNLRWGLADELLAPAP